MAYQDISTRALETGGNLASIKNNTDKIPSLGQALAAASVPVVLPTATVTTLTPPAAITNFANETGGNLAAIKADVDKIPSQGQALAAASLPVVLTAAQMTTLTPVSAVTATLAAETTKVIGTVNMAAGQSIGITANSAVNNAQVAGTAVSVNAGAKDAGTQRVTIATDQTAVTTAGVFSVKTDQTTHGTTDKVAADVYMGGVAVASGAPLQCTIANTGANATAVKVNVASGGIASGGIASGAIASGAIASGAIASGAAVAGSLADGSLVTLGLKADAKSTATDTTAITLMQVAKQISASVQAPTGSSSTGGAVPAQAYYNGGISKSADPAATTTGYLTGIMLDLLGKIIVHPYALPQQLVSGATSDITNTTATTIITGVASNYLYITNILVTNSHATVGTFVNITEETSGTILYTGYAAPLGGGFSLSLPCPLKVPTAAKALQATCVTTGSNVRVSASGYKATI